MQIDFHHGVTYVVARHAGFSHPEAEIIAYCAQYVDDATQSGIIQFDNGACFSRISSAHRKLDYRNFQDLANYRVWLPFHFLPGNGGLPVGQSPEGSFIETLICRPNSDVAQNLIREVIVQRDDACTLHRLGVAMHTYVDTWAHQGFAGVSHAVNDATDLVLGDGQPDERMLTKLLNYFINNALPLGHGTVLTNPDQPYLVWGYTNGLGQQIRRDNPQDFLEAADCMCQAMRRYRLGDADAQVSGLEPGDRHQIDQMLRSLTQPDPSDRHQTWLGAIAAGQFSFGPAQVSYIPKGEGSWKAIALGSAEEDGDYPFSEAFLSSNWKYFHDALQLHRLFVVHDLLPRYGICVA